MNNMVLVIADKYAKAILIYYNSHGHRKASSIVWTKGDPTCYELLRTFPRCLRQGTRQSHPKGEQK